MNFKVMVASTALIMSLTAFSSFAVSEQMPGDKEHHINRHLHEGAGDKAEEDPIKALENKKERIRTLLKEGIISKEKAEKIINKIDNRIADIKEFQKLPLEKKREKVIKDFKTQLDELVKNGKMSQEDSNQMMKEITEKINTWDGTGYPMLYNRDKK